MAAALCAAAAVAAADDAGSIRGSPTYRPEVVGRVGVVAAGRHFAAEAGMRMLARGGNAIDAGVAATFAAAVTEISHFGLGGEVPLILYLADQKQAIVVNGQGVAPAAAWAIPSENSPSSARHQTSQVRERTVRSPARARWPVRAPRKRSGRCRPTPVRRVPPCCP